MATADKIRAIRLSNGITMEEFGALFKPEADKSIVSRWEKGTSLPNASRIKRIAEIGNTTVDELLKSEYKSCDTCRYDMIKKGYNYCPICGMKV